MLVRKCLVKLFGEKQTVFYDQMLQEAEEVVGKTPQITEVLEKGVNLELYTGASGEGTNTWAIAIIAVHGKGWVFRTKYDSGRINNDLDQMVKECLININNGWNVNYWKQMAEKEVAENRRWIDRYL